MADVTGQFGQEDIQLNNAATEATLKQLLAATKIIAAKSASEFKNQEDFDKALKNLATRSKNAAKSGKKFEESNLRSYKAQQKNTDAVEDATDAYEDASARLQKFAGFANKLANAAINLTQKVSSAANSIQGMDGSIGSAVNALGEIPGGFGDMIKAVYGPTAAALDKTHASFVDVASVGANFGGNMRQLIRGTAEMGLEMGQFVNIVKNNGEAMMLLGGDTATGAKMLQNFGKELRKTPVFNDLSRLGYSTEAMNEGFARYTKLQARAGRTDFTDTVALTQQTGQYLKNLDAVSKLTGKTKDTLQAEQDARQNEAKYRIMLAELGPTQAAEMEKLMDAIPAQHQKGLREIIATGRAGSKEAQDLMAFMPEVAQAGMETYRNIQAGAGLGNDFANTFYETYKKSASDFANSGVAKTMGLYNDEMNDFVIEALNVRDRQKTLAETSGQVNDELNKVKEKIASGATTDLIDPATVTQFRAKILENAGKMTENLASVDISKLTEIFDTTLPLAVEGLPKILNAAAENFYAVAGTVTGLKVAAGLATIALNAMSAAATMSSMMGGDRMGRNRRGPKGPKGRFGGLKNMASAGGRFASRLAAPLAIGYGMYEGYTNYQDIEAQRQAGEITDNQATVQKSQAVGSAAGGTGGALAGAAAGAAIGSVVPIVGTAIGGMIGGAIGWWAGSKAGSEVGEVIGDALTGPDTIKDLQAKIVEKQKEIQDIGEGTWTNWSSDDEKEELKQLEAQLATMKAKEAQAASAKPAESTSTTATTAQNTLDQAAEEQKKLEEEYQKKVAEINKQAEAAKAETTQTAAAAGATTKTPEETMSLLNTNMEELVRLTSMTNMLMQKQIGATTGLNSDAFSV